MVLVQLLFYCHVRLFDLFFPQKVERSRPQSPDELLAVLEGVGAMEALVQAAEESHRE